MKSKSLTYLLLAVVGIIWYQVFFRVKDTLFAENAALNAQSQQHVSFQLLSRDTVELKANYRDPFHLKKGTPNNGLLEELPPQRPVQNAIVRSVKPQMLWPDMRYYGLVRRNESNKPLALLKADGLLFNLRLGDEIYNSMYVRVITPDSVVIRLGKHQKTVYRN